MGWRRAGILVAIGLAVSAVAQRDSLPNATAPTKVFGRTVDTARHFPRIAKSALAPARGSSDGFPGIGYSGQFPPNPDLAVGPGHVVQVVNGHIAFFTKEGVQTFGQSASTFFNGLAQTASQSEPQALFDRTSGRFFVLFLENDIPAEVSNFLLAVSDDADPHGVWHQYRFTAVGFTQDDDHWSVRPSLAVSENGIAITTTLYRYFDSALRGSMFTTMPKDASLSGAPLTISRTHDNNWPWVHVGESIGTTGPVIYAVVRQQSGQSRFYIIRNITTSVHINFHDQGHILTPAAPATVASTDGGLLETGGFPSTAFAVHGAAAMVAYSTVTGGTRSAIRWFLYDLTLIQQHQVPILGTTLVSHATGSHFVPAMGVNAYGEYSLLFSTSGPTVTSDLSTMSRTKTDSFAYISTPMQRAWADGSPYSDTRWGGFFGVAADAEGDEFWGTGAVVREDGTWGTEIVRWRVGEGAVVAPNSFAWSGGTGISGSIGDLAEDDGNELSGRTSSPLLTLTFEGVAPSGEVIALGLDLRSRANTTGLMQRIELWDWTAGAWVDMGAVAATTGESLRSVSATGVLSRFVQPGTGALRGRAGWWRSGPVVVWPWSVHVDQSVWRLRLRG